MPSLDIIAAPTDTRTRPCLNVAIPRIAAGRGYVDGMFHPHETWRLLQQPLHPLREKQIHWHTQCKYGLTPGY